LIGYALETQNTITGWGLV